MKNQNYSERRSIRKTSESAKDCRKRKSKTIFTLYQQVLKQEKVNLKLRKHLNLLCLVCKQLDKAIPMQSAVERCGLDSELSVRARDVVEPPTSSSLIEAAASLLPHQILANEFADLECEHFQLGESTKLEAKSVTQSATDRTIQQYDDELTINEDDDDDEEAEKEDFEAEPNEEEVRILRANSNAYEDEFLIGENDIEDDEINDAIDLDQICGDLF